MDKRDNTRRHVRIYLRAEPGEIRAFTGDLSRGGLFIVCTKTFPPGTRVRIQVDTPSGVALGVGTVKWAKRVPTQVMRDIKGGMGIEFTWLSSELKKLIEEKMSV